MADQATKILTCADAGRIGGAARARKLTSEQRRQIARNAARARWQKKAHAPTPTDPNPTDPRGPQHRDVQGAEAGILLNSRRKPIVPVSKISQPGGLRVA